MTIGDRLKEERERIGLTQPDLYEITGVTKKTISGYENDLTSPNAEFLSAMSAHGADVFYILTGKRIGLVSEDNPGYRLRPDQVALLDNYEHCSKEGRKLVAQVAMKSAKADSMDSEESKEGTKQTNGNGG